MANHAAHEVKAGPRLVWSNSSGIKDVKYLHSTDSSFMNNVETKKTIIRMNDGGTLVVGDALVSLPDNCNEGTLKGYRGNGFWGVESFLQCVRPENGWKIKL